MIYCLKNIRMGMFGLAECQLISLQRLKIFSTKDLAAYLNSLNGKKIDLNLFKDKLVEEGLSKVANARAIVILVRTLLITRCLVEDDARKYYSFSASFPSGKNGLVTCVGAIASLKDYFSLVEARDYVASRYRKSPSQICIHSFAEIGRETYAEYMEYLSNSD